MSDVEKKATLTISDIAARAGVSKATVSRVLNNQPDVSEATRRRIKELLKETRFIRNPAAAALAGSPVNSIGIVIPDLGNPWSTSLLQGVGGVANEHSFNLVLWTLGDQHQLFSQMIQNLRSGFVKGVLMVSPPWSEYKELRSIMQSEAWPVVAIGDLLAEGSISGVQVKDEKGAMMATEHLLEMGHRRIGFIKGDSAYRYSTKRLKGYKKALKSADVRFDDALVVDSKSTEKSGYWATRRLMEVLKPPTAVFASTDLLAIGALHAMKELGVRVPEDVSLMGFDGISSTQFTDPPLSTVEQPVYEMGRLGAQMLIERMAGKSTTLEQVELETELIIRESTGLCKR